LEKIKTRLRELGEPEDAEPMNKARACFEFANEMHVGDWIFAKKGRSAIVGYGNIASAYLRDETRERYKNVRRVDWLGRGEWSVREKPFVTKAVTEIGKYPSFVAEIRRAVGLDAPPLKEPPTGQPYTLAGAAKE